METMRSGMPTTEYYEMGGSTSGEQPVENSMEGGTVEGEVVKCWQLHRWAKCVG